jgi:hypothetical protein
MQAFFRLLVVVSYPRGILTRRFVKSLPRLEVPTDWRFSHFRKVLLKCWDYYMLPTMSANRMVIPRQLRHNDKVG